MYRKMNGKNESVRNFSIIAHIDHGKSTLADRILELAQVTDARTQKDQVLDSMELERERGITIKSNSVSFQWKRRSDGKEYLYNLIDTPGHVDFTYEVSRSLAACEGALLLVDASQGIEAQTLSNLYLAMENQLSILPVINKIDLPSADINRTRNLIQESLGLDPELAIPVSARTGENVIELLDRIADIIPPPQGNSQAPLRALVYDSYYDSFAGAVMKIRIFDGSLQTRDKIQMMSTGRKFQTNEIGISSLCNQPVPELKTGEVGYVIAGIKTIEDTRVGDTVTNADDPSDDPLPGYREACPMVFAGLFPIQGDDFENFKDAMDRLKLNDSSLSFEQESSPALGFGLRVGYLGLLHMEIIQERLRREFHLDLLSTAPSVCYRLYDTKGKELLIDNPSRWPDSTQITRMEEPMAKAVIITPQSYLGKIFALLQEKRGIQLNISYLANQRVELMYHIPLAELIFEFYDRLKSCSSGFASLDYESAGFSENTLVKLDILVNGEPVDALASIVHKSQAEQRGRRLIERLKDLIPRHQFQIPIQASIGSKVIARENISPLRKNVTAKCYGGDITRKRKLLEKQKEGKRKMKQIGRVDIPQEAFLAVLKRD